MYSAPSIEDFRTLAKERKYEVFGSGLEPFKLNIVGFRNPRARPNHFDDAIGVYWSDENDQWRMRSYAATTLPGVPYLLKPVVSSGCAVLVPDQYEDAYSVGWYRGKLALKQVRPVAVWRDNNFDEHVNCGGRVEEGVFGIHIHSAGFLSRWIGLHSAGCQVIQSQEDFRDFMALVGLSAHRWGPLFTYSLMELANE